MTGNKRRKDPLRQTQKDIVSLTGIGVTTSVGSLTLGQIGGSAATQAQLGLSKFSSLAFPIGGTLIAGRTLLGLTKNLELPKPKIGKKRRGF